MRTPLGVKQENRARLDSVPLGLAVARIISPPGYTWTLDELADVCGCSPALIDYYEKKALRNIRARLRTDPDLAAALKEATP